MREDQYQKLQDMSEKLTDVFLVEADPDNWPGSGWEPTELTKDQRGDRYWSKKNAAATLTLAMKVANLNYIIKERGRGAGMVNPEDETLDAEIASAEREATKILDDLVRGKRKAEFKKRAIGKT